MKIGVRLECLGLPLRKALDDAARMGVSGVQFDAAADLTPQRLSQTGRRELRQLLSARNLSLSALGCPLRHSLDTFENQEPRLEHVKKVMELAYELGARLIILHAGRLPREGEADNLREPLAALGRHGDRTGCTIALETGLDAGSTVAAYLDRFDSASLAANLDPGNLLTHGFDPLASGVGLGRYLQHVHAKDARADSPSRAAREAPLGAGDIDWLAFLDMLRGLEYRGFLIVEREEGDRRRADVVAGVNFLRRLVG